MVTLWIGRKRSGNANSGGTASSHACATSRRPARLLQRAARAALWGGGGFDTPARGLYPRLCHSLRKHGILSLRVRFRRPTSLPDAVADALEGIEYQRRHNATAVALTGHSFGGAVVVRAALSEPDVVRTVVTLASQGIGADGIGMLHCPVLLIHGEADDVLALRCSLLLHRLAPEPKRLILMPGTGHGWTKPPKRCAARWTTGSSGNSAHRKMAPRPTLPGDPPCPVPSPFCCSANWRGS